MTASYQGVLNLASQLDHGKHETINFTRTAVTAVSAVTYFVWEDLLQSLAAQPTGLQLLPGLLGGLAPHQSLCLGQEVGYQDLEPHQSHRYSETEQHNVCFALSNTEYLLILNIIQITCHHYHLNINISHD